MTVIIIAHLMLSTRCVWVHSGIKSDVMHFSTAEIPLIENGKPVSPHISLANSHACFIAAIPCLYCLMFTFSKFSNLTNKRETKNTNNLSKINVKRLQILVAERQKWERHRNPIFVLATKINVGGFLS